MTPAKRKRLVESLNTAALKVLNAVPRHQAATVHQIEQAMADTGLNPNHKGVLKWLNTLRDSGLIEELEPRRFKQVIVRVKRSARTTPAPVPAVTQEEAPMSKPVSKNRMTFMQRMAVARLMMDHPHLTRADMLAKVDGEVDFPVTEHNLEGIAKEIRYKFQMPAGGKTPPSKQLRVDLGVLAGAMLRIIDGLGMEMPYQTRASLERMQTRSSTPTEAEQAED